MAIELPESIEQKTVRLLEEMNSSLKDMLAVWTEILSEDSGRQPIPRKRVLTPRR